jgi:electron-transferring-flavoprotein dehydrogenase
MGKKGSASLSLAGKLKTGVVTAVRTRGHWGTLYEAYQVNKLATKLKEVYDEYPPSPSGFEAWQAERDEIMDDVYAVTGADPKY